jgi:hypothetical protein
MMMFRLQGTVVVESVAVMKLTELERKSYEVVQEWFKQTVDSCGSATKMTAACELKLADLFKGFAEVFGQGMQAISLSPLPTAVVLDKLKAWRLSPEYIRDLLEFARSCGDKKLLDQLTFLVGVQKVYSVAPACVEIIQTATSWESRQLNELTASAVKMLRHELYEFIRFIGGTNLDALFAESGKDSVHATCLDSKWNGVTTGEFVQQQARGLLANFGDTWTADFVAMTERMSQWTPAWQTKRDTLFSDVELQKTLLGNKHVNALSQMTVIANNAKNLLRDIHKDSAKLGHMVDPVVVKAMELAISNGVETVTISFAVWNLKCEIPKERNVNLRIEKVAALEKQLREKGVTVGKDMVERMIELKSKDFKASAPTGAVDVSA